MDLTCSRCARGIFRNSEETIGLLPTNVPADETPMPSTRGSFEAAVLKALTMPSYW